MTIKTLEKHLEAFQQRVVDEKQALDEKIAKLEAFRNGPTWTGVEAGEKGRLEAQLSIMQAYSRILGLRISAF